MLAGCKDAVNTYHLLKDNKIKFIMPTTEYKFDYIYQWEKDFTYLDKIDMNGIVEGNTPFENLADGIIMLDSHMKRSGSALVHCLQSANRTAIFLTAFIVAKCGVRVDDPVRYLKKLRPIVDIAKPGPDMYVSPLAYLRNHEEHVWK